MLTEDRKPFKLNSFNKMTRDYAKVSDRTTKTQMCHIAHKMREQALADYIDFAKFKKIVGLCQARQRKATVIALLALIFFSGNSKLQGTKDELKLKIAYIQFAQGSEQIDLNIFTRMCREFS